MDNESPAIKGWRGFKFQFGQGIHQDAQPVEQTQQELTAQLEHHIEELAFGGYRASHIEDAD